MSTQRNVVIVGGVAVGIWWLWFTCKGREVLNRIMRALGRPEVKPCCTGCADHVPSGASSGAADAPPPPPAPPPSGYGGNFAYGETAAAVPAIPSVVVPGLAPPPEPAGAYAPGASYAPLPPPPPPPAPGRFDASVPKSDPSSFTSCVEPACRSSEPAPADVDVKPAVRVPELVSGLTKEQIDRLPPPPPPTFAPVDTKAGTVGVLGATRELVRGLAPSFLKPATATYTTLKPADDAGSSLFTLSENRR